MTSVSVSGLLWAVWWVVVVPPVVVFVLAHAVWREKPGHRRPRVGARVSAAWLWLVSSVPR